MVFFLIHMGEERQGVNDLFYSSHDGLFFFINHFIVIHTPCVQLARSSDRNSLALVHSFLKFGALKENVLFHPVINLTIFVAV